MKRKILSLLASLALALPIVMASAPTTLALGGACASGQGSNKHIWIQKQISEISGASYFDDVYGYANIAPLSTCYSSEVGHSSVLPANLQDSGGIFAQLGYQKASDQNYYFVYAIDSPVAHLITTVTPNQTHTYRFRIYRRSSGYVSFEIYDVTAGAFVWTYYPTSLAWNSTVDLAWWGFEAANNLQSSHGSRTTQEWSKIWWMAYSWEDTTNMTFRSSLSCYGDPQGNDNVQKNFADDGSVYPHACPEGGGTRLALIDTTVYTGDTLRVWTDE